jgi:hypothetical protein
MVVAGPTQCPDHFHRLPKPRIRSRADGPSECLQSGTGSLLAFGSVTRPRRQRDGARHRASDSAGQRPRVRSEELGSCGSNEMTRR